MTFTESVKTCFSKYATFSGRASRSEFWFFVLFYILLDIIVSTVCISLDLSEDISDWIDVFVFSILFLPSLAVAVRRLHDTNKSGWWAGSTFALFLVLSLFFAIFSNIDYFLSLEEMLSYLDVLFIFCCLILILLIILSVVLLIFTIFKGTAGPNKYGPDPLARDEINDIGMECMTFTESIITCFKKAFTFSGRASRSELWWFYLFNFLLAILVSIICMALGFSEDNVHLIKGFVSLIFFLPNLAVTFRRLHDTNWSGWWWGASILLFLASLVHFHEILQLIMLIGGVIISLVIFIRMFIKGTIGPNKYGPDPLEKVGDKK